MTLYDLEDLTPERYDQDALETVLDKAQEGNELYMELQHHIEPYHGETEDLARHNHLQIRYSDWDEDMKTASDVEPPLTRVDLSAGSADCRLTYDFPVTRMEGPNGVQEYFVEPYEPHQLVERLASEDINMLVDCHPGDIQED